MHENNGQPFIVFKFTVFNSALKKFEKISLTLGFIAYRNKLYIFVQECIKAGRSFCMQIPNNLYVFCIAGIRPLTIADGIYTF